MKVTVLGAAGGIGQPLSLILKNNLPAGSSLSLYDVNPATPGVAKDLSHIPTDVSVEGFSGTDATPALVGTDVVIIPAGVARKPGMTRDDLFNINAGIVRDLVTAIGKTAPNAIIAIITNPVNSMVPLAAEVLKKLGVYNPKKLFGVSTLDVLRSETFLAEKLKYKAGSIKVNVVGGHSGNTILPLLSQVPQASNFDQATIEQLTTRIQNAGTEVVEAKAGAGSATLSMATAGARLALSIVKAKQGEPGIVECSYVQGGTDYADFLAQPVRLGTDGIEEYLPLGPMSDYEKKCFNDMLPTLKDNIQKGVDFINK